MCGHLTGHSTGIFAIRLPTFVHTGRMSETVTIVTPACVICPIDQAPNAIGFIILFA